MIKKSFLLFVFSGLFLACSSTSFQNKKKKLYPNNGDNLLKNEQAKIIEKDSFYIFDSKHFSINLPYTWRSYLEPSAKEQIRHSPYNKKEKKMISNVYLWIKKFEKDESKVEKSIQGIIARAKENPRYQNVKTSKENEGENLYYKLNYFVNIDNVNFNDEVKCYPLKDGFLYIKKSLPIDSVGVYNYVDELLATIKIKESL